MSRIKIAIYDSNETFLNRFNNALNRRYQNKIDIHTFSTLELLLNFIQNEKIDAVILDKNVRDRMNQFGKCPIAFLVDSEDDVSFENDMTIFRYQRVDFIYNAILDLISSNKKEDRNFTFNQDTSCKMLTFFSSSGGSGGSTIAAAVSYHLAKNNRKVLFLMLDPFGTPSVFFQGDGSLNLSDLFISIKKKRGLFKLKLESAIKLDSSNVYYLEGPTSPLDLLELTNDEFSYFIQEIISSNLFDDIIIDSKIWTPSILEVFVYHSQKIVLVSKGTECSNLKLLKLLHLLQSIFMKVNVDSQYKIYTLYNKFSLENSSKLEQNNLIYKVNEILQYNCHSTKELALFLSNSEEIKYISEELG